MPKCILLLLLFPLFNRAQELTEVNRMPLPTAAQLKWHEMEFYLFVHFGPNTFTNKEWGEGNEPADAFNPTALNCRQWARIAKAAGAKGIIITAKHHDGFCLWPSRYSTHTVRQSKWKNGKGDVLKELSAACKEYGLKFGVYISPWDRNHPKYGTPEYNDVFVNMMKEIFTNYSPIWELWWDGANGEGPNGKKQEYDWARFKKTVKELSPNTVVFSDVGPHIRWIGNEKGIAGKTNWNTLDTAGFTPGLGAPHVDTLNQGNVHGKNWIPGECDVSIRPGWFYHSSEDEKVKTPEQLFDLYLKSVGRGANLLLNVPPDRRGLIHENDSVALMQFKKFRSENFDTAKRILPKSIKAEMTFPSYLEYSNGKLACRSGEILWTGPMKFLFASPQLINCIVLAEQIQSGQRIMRFNVKLKLENGEIQQLEASTIGRKRILTFPARKVSEITLEVTESKATLPLKEAWFYLIDAMLVEKEN